MLVDEYVGVFSCDLMMKCGWVMVLGNEEWYVLRGW